MINHYNPIVAWAFILYLIGSVASLQFLIGYKIHQLIKKIKRNKEGDLNAN
jgi:hypothetical protein